MRDESSKYKIAIVDDHALFAGSLEKLINSFPNFVTIFHLRNGLELQKKLAEDDNVPDVILIDINMPVMNGFETAEWLSQNHPQIKFLALTMDDDEMNILKMLRLGAKGYLLKDIEPEYLHVALNEVIEKGYFHSEKVSDALLNSLVEPKGKKELTFKKNELIFLKLASSEMTYKEIADVMQLSPKTIDGYRQELFNRLEIKNRVGLVIFALKNNIIKL
ncbi:response regulator transcription factor [Aequorivita sp. H23M31]|uniref:Response regulator transcription factor n=1 Tax=Aequorivita ciconiae TaxID=2494375 RepID=A0A410G226_9FLAO|nr:response regulator transcription factor [Aequorivita sp. H23M31]QAA81324.1 response regulator transcription factor [Aequorivita sp. H23M31]